MEPDLLSVAGGAGVLGFCAPGGRLTWNCTCPGVPARAAQSWGSTAGERMPTPTTGFAGAAVVTVDLKFEFSRPQGLLGVSVAL